MRLKGENEKSQERQKLIDDYSQSGNIYACVCVNNDSAPKQISYEHIIQFDNTIKTTQDAKNLFDDNKQRTEYAKTTHHQCRSGKYSTSVSCEYLTYTLQTVFTSAELPQHSAQFKFYEKHAENSPAPFTSIAIKL